MFARSTPESRLAARDQAALIGQLQTSVTKNATRELEAIADHVMTPIIASIALFGAIGIATQLIESVNL